MIALKAKQAGFTLIEIMITVAIVGILSTIGLSAYGKYVAKSQVSEAFIVADHLKVVVYEYYAQHGEPPWSLTALGYPATDGKYINDTWFLEDEGVFVIQMGGNAKGVHRAVRWKEIYLKFIEQETNMKVECTSNLEQQYLPMSCTSVL